MFFKFFKLTIKTSKQALELNKYLKQLYIQIWDKKFKKKSAWRKYMRAFNISTTIIEKNIQRDKSGKVTDANFIVKAMTPDGRSAEGFGNCSKFERGFNKHNHDIPSTAMTRAVNREVLDLIVLVRCQQKKRMLPLRLKKSNELDIKTMITSTIFFVCAEHDHEEHLGNVFLRWGVLPLLFSSLSMRRLLLFKALFYVLFSILGCFSVCLLVYYIIFTNYLLLLLLFLIIFNYFIDFRMLSWQISILLECFIKNCFKSFRPNNIGVYNVKM